MDPILGSIMIFGGNFAPKGWFLCNGQILSISQYSALFSLLGTTYGGNGTTTFALPDMRGRTCLSAGQGAGLRDYQLGEMAGTNSAQILVSNLPSAPITIKCSSNEGTSPEPSTNVMAVSKNGDDVYAAANTGFDMMAPAILQGGNQPLNITPPYLVMNWCIAWQGIYPSRP
jgi:microcystin-dependent protein